MTARVATIALEDALAPPSSPALSTRATNLVAPCSLKRKRPPKLHIPQPLQDIQLEPLTHKNDLVYIDNGVAVSSIKGKKKLMEDAYQIFAPPRGNSNKCFFGVYDGHGGVNATQFVVNHLGNNILKKLGNCIENEAKVEAVKDAYLKAHHDFLQQGLSSGVCCVTALIDSKEAIISNLGDCKAILCKGGVAEALTEDHRVDNAEERERIKSKGGYVEINKGAWRVHGILSVSRSIGDAHLKAWLMAEPETRILQLNSGMEFLILASDGLWEKVGNQEAVDVLLRLCPVERIRGEESDKENEYLLVNYSPSRKRRRIWIEDEKNKLQGRPPSDLAAACAELVGLAVSKGSLDDITVMIIDLRHFYSTS